MSDRTVTPLRRRERRELLERRLHLPAGHARQRPRPVHARLGLGELPDAEVRLGERDQHPPVAVLRAIGEYPDDLASDRA